MPERFRDAHQQGFKRHLETGEAHVMGKTVELAGRRKDGTEFPLELSLASWGTSEGIFFTGIIRDITERKRAEGALHESEQRFHAFWDNSPSLNFLKDVEGRYLNVNKEFERALRVSREQIKGKRDDEVFPPEQAAAFQADDQQVLRTGAPMEIEEVSLQEDGPHTSIVHKFPLLDAEGEVYATGGIARDITERKRVEEALRHGEETLRLLVDGVKDHALFMLDPEGRVASWNTGAERIKGYRAEEIIGQDSSRFFTPEDIEQGKPELGLRTATAEGRFEDEGCGCAKMDRGSGPTSSLRRSRTRRGSCADSPR